MRSRLTVILILGVGLVFALLFARQMYVSRTLPREKFTQKKLRILTYSTFVGSAGPGATILDRFKKENDLELDVVTAGDAGLLLERARLMQESVPFDVVIGFDQFMLKDASTKMQWRPVPVAREGWEEPLAAFSDVHFQPFDWSPMAFVYRKSDIQPPKTMAELLDARFKGKIALQDPRSSSPGMQFFNWVETVQGAGAADFFARLKPNVQSVAPSWAFSYGLFKKKQADLVFSYVTSLAFHWGLEHDENYQIAVFPEGHPVQVEFAAVPVTCRECELAEKLVRTLVEPWAQTLIMERNFMFPVVKGLEEGTVFAKLPKVKTLSEIPEKSLSDWDKTFKP